MKRQFAIFIGVSLAIVVWGLIYGPQVVADLTIFYPTSVDAVNTKVVLSLGNLADSTATQEEYFLTVQDIQRVVVRRLDYLNLTEYYKVVAQGNQLEATLPNNENIAYLINIITRVGQIEFIDGGASPPVGQLVKTGEMSIYGEGIYQTLFTGQEITTIIPPNSDTGDIFYQIKLQPAAVERFVDFANTKTNAYACLVLDKQVINCSKMYHLSGNTLDILPNLGSGTGISLADMAIFLKSGPLPVTLKVITGP